jgi:hypothetical protein
MRKHLIWVLGLAVALASVAIATAAPNTQTITGKVAPKKLPKKEKKAVSLAVDVAATNPGNPNQIPFPTTLAKVDFDKDIKIQQKGLDTCDPTQFTAATTTAQAKSACSDSAVGAGSSAIAVPTGPSTPPLSVTATVTAFNGAAKTLVLHTYNSLSGAQTLVGKIGKDSSAGGAYGTTLNVPVPPLAGGTAVITQFDTKVKKVYNSGGKKRTLIASSCKDKKIKFQARFTDNQGQTATGKFTQKCTQKKT